jgi:hypothetical protein
MPRSQSLLRRIRIGSGRADDPSRYALSSLDVDARRKRGCRGGKAKAIEHSAFFGSAGAGRQVSSCGGPPAGIYRRL